MLNSFKKGFGFTTGSILGFFALQVIAKTAIYLVADDDKYMEKLKTEDPKLYFRLEKYKSHKEDTE